MTDQVPDEGLPIEQHAEKPLFDLQTFYFDTIRVTDNSFITDQEHHDFYTQVCSRRDTIYYYSDLLAFYRPILLEALTKIYYHPEISTLLTIIPNSEHPRQHYNTLRFLLNKHIQSQFPYGDIHLQLVQSFISSIASNKTDIRHF